MKYRRTIIPALIFSTTATLTFADTFDTQLNSIDAIQQQRQQQHQQDQADRLQPQSEVRLSVNQA